MFAARTRSESRIARTTALERRALSCALVDADRRSQKARMGNPAAGSRTGRSDPLEAKRTRFAFELCANAICFPWKEIRESRRLLANDEVSRSAKRSARKVSRPRM